MPVLTRSAVKRANANEASAPDVATNACTNMETAPNNLVEATPVSQRPQALERQETRLVIGPSATVQDQFSTPAPRSPLTTPPRIERLAPRKSSLPQHSLPNVSIGYSDVGRVWKRAISSDSHANDDVLDEPGPIKPMRGVDLVQRFHNGENVVPQGQGAVGTQDRLGSPFQLLGVKGATRPLQGDYIANSLSQQGSMTQFFASGPDTVPGSKSGGAVASYTATAASDRVVFPPGQRAKALQHEDTFAHLTARNRSGHR